MLLVNVSEAEDHLQAGYANVAGGRVYYETKGVGHSVVLIHAGLIR